MRESGGERVRCFAVLLYRVEARGQERPRCLSPRSRETFEMTTELVILIAEKNKRTWTSVREDVKDDRFRAREVLETGVGEARSGLSDELKSPELFSGGSRETETESGSQVGSSDESTADTVRKGEGGF